VNRVNTSQYARRTHERISNSWHACMNEPVSMNQHACWMLLMLLANAGCCCQWQQIS
jgi:hypothetical protein